MERKAKAGLGIMLIILALPAVLISDSADPGIALMVVGLIFFFSGAKGPPQSPEQPAAG